MGFADCLVIYHNLGHVVTVTRNTAPMNSQRHIEMKSLISQVLMLWRLRNAGEQVVAGWMSAGGAGCGGDELFYLGAKRWRGIDHVNADQKSVVYNV